MGALEACHSSTHISLPRVTVVVPTRNRVELLRSAVLSVLGQSERNLELIIVDDASTDGTGTYLTRLIAEDRRVRVVRNDTAKGGPAARNSGIAESRARWIAFLDDDDEWLPTKLERQLAMMNANPTTIACSCSYFAATASGSMTKRSVPERVTLRELLINNHLGGASMCLCSSEALAKIGGFDETLRSAQDLDLWVRLRRNGEIVSCRDALVIHRIHAGPRITNNMRSQYLGARHFYFKHRALMDAPVRQHRIAYNCFIMSRQPTRRWRDRLRYLTLAVLNSSATYAMTYAKSSGSRLLGDILFMACHPAHRANKPNHSGRNGS
jgi:glycosyltransferase involved in cell wall biosynthesis